MTNSNRAMWIMLAAGTVIGVGASVGLGIHSFKEPTWARAMRERMDEHSAMLDQQRLLLESLGGAINDLRPSRPVGDSGRGCLTLADLRAELATANKVAQTAPNTLDESKDSSTVRTGEAAKQEAARMVEAAVSAGHWTEQDGTQFRSLLGSMTPRQRDEALSVLFRAINEHQLPVERHGAF
jgi:hypothetical protein